MVRMPSCAIDADDPYLNAPCAYLVLDRNGQILKMNQAGSSWFGDSGVVGKRTIFDLVIPEERGACFSAFEHLVPEGAIGGIQLGMRRRDGLLLSVLLNANALQDEEGHFAGSRVILTDLQQRVGAVQAMRRIVESEGKYRSVISAMEEGTLLFDTSGPVIACNAGAERLLGIPAQQIMGKKLAELPFFFRSERRSEIRNEDLFSGFVKDMELILPSPYGKDRILLASYQPLHSNGDADPFACMLILRDITEARRQQAELEETCRELRELSARQQSVREEERTRVAREIHDELGAVLTAIKFDLSWAVERIGKKAEFAEVFSGLDSAIRNIKQICTSLRPSILDDLGLLAAIEWQAGAFSSRTGIVCKLVHDSRDPEAFRSVSTDVFRIFQETLTNIARHAGATRVDIGFHLRNGKLNLTVSDNGVGIEKGTQSKSLGILGMRERAKSIGGTLVVGPGRFGGTRVLFEIPLEGKKAAGG